MRHNSDALSRRAAGHILSSRYLSLATAGRNAVPWACAVAFVECADCSFLFSSAVSSRHVINVFQNSLVAGVTYNSCLPSQEADGVQFQGSCSRLQGDALTTAARHHVARYKQKEDAATPRGYQLPATVEERWGPTSAKGLFQIFVERLWVLNLSNYSKSELDIREEVSADGVWQLILDDINVQEG